ncbi:hypothetical protein BKA93DRAFT_831210 [Sparassis latifolia]
MANSIVGTLPIKHTVDPNGSLFLDVPLQLPSAKVSPKISLSYHSAATNISAIGKGWVIKGASVIERVPATVAQDGFRGVINYDKNDRFALDGQRLVSIGGNKYRFEIEQWSKVTAKGSDPANPEYWTEHLPDGTTRIFGNTRDSNIKAKGGTGTRVWAITESSDGFSNYVTYSYNNDIRQGAFYLTELNYGGNLSSRMAHQRRITFEYETRPDKLVKYIGGYEVSIDKRLTSISSHVQNNFVHKHHLQYDEAPVTGTSRLINVALSDPSGASVRPLKFDWVNGNRAIFDPLDPSRAVTIETEDPNAQVLPLDVNASGRSSLVIASKRIRSGYQKLHLAVHIADDDGRIPSSPDSVLDSLPFPKQIIPLDINGNGKTDLLHITSTMSSHTLTVILSTPQGYEPQQPVTFSPETMGGHFHSGDFEGNGQVGLVYIYNRMSGGRQNVRFVQFVSDRKQFTALPPRDGPAYVSLKNLHVVVGDLNGDGAEDVFVIYSKIKSGRTVGQIDLLRSQDGRLCYRQDDGLTKAGEAVLWKSTITFLPYPADEDGKTSLLAVSDNNGYLSTQLLRSTGPSLLLPSSPLVTNIAYNGHLTLARTTSTGTVDLVNTFTKLSGDRQTNVNVLRFFNNTFVNTEDVAQPGKSSTSVVWSDVRGIGRADCLLNTIDIRGKLTISPMMCSSSQPLDFISGYENGLGSRISVSYAPLSDGSIYRTDSTPESPLPALNAMARNVSLSTTLTSSPTQQETAHGRSQLMYFPSWVVKQLDNTPCAAKPDVVDQTNYKYANARLNFDGRGWLGFEEITKSSRVLGTSEKTHYRQEYPFTGHVSQVEIRSGGRLLQDNRYNFETTRANARNNCSVRLRSVLESTYEAGALAYEVDVSYAYDAFNNATNLTIKSPQLQMPAFTIQSTFENNEQFWVLGSKTLEVVKQNGVVLKQTKYAFVPHTQTTKEVSSWVSGDTWLARIFEFDETGNETIVKGPGPAKSSFTYDETKSHAVATLTYTSADGPPLKETSAFDLVHDKPVSVTDSNGFTTSTTYDVLGRMQEISQGDSHSGMSVVEKQSFYVDGTDFYQLSQIRTELRAGEDSWMDTVDHIDGLNRKWRSERPRPDDPSAFIYTDVEFDGAGRVVARSRDYFAGSVPTFTRYTYDMLSRVIKQTLPPASSGVSPITITSRYEFQSGISKITETRSDGNQATDQISTREVQFLPNPEPSASKFVKPFVVRSTNELQQSIQTVFDGLGRPVRMKDPSDVQLSLTWDGLSRATERRLTNSGNKDISHFVAKYDVDLCLTTVYNKLTGLSTTTESDFIQRPISRTTADETLTYTYDKRGQNTKQRLVSVTSSKGIDYHFDYNIRGKLIAHSLSLDGHKFVTSHEWSPFGQLLRTTNPDGTTIARTSYRDGESVNRVVLTDTDNTTRAWIALDEFKDVFSRPLICEFGNGLRSTSSIMESGMLASRILSKGSNVLHRQDWKIDAFSRIANHSVGGGRSTSQFITPVIHSSTIMQFVQLLSDSSSLVTQPEEFSYDQSGNITYKGGRKFVNDGWQLSKIIGGDGHTECSFTYSPDGNLISKSNGAGIEKNTMKYDANGRLVQLDETSFVYDFSGHLIKAVLPNGDVTMYPSQSYEVTVSASGRETHTSYLVHGYRRASLSTTKENVKGRSHGPVVYYYHTDHLGSTVAASDEKGNIVTLYHYDGFGKVSIDGPDVARYKYSGKEQFAGFYYFGARFYDPDVSHQLRELFVVNEISPSTFNMYSFSRNDPINFIDLNGNVPKWHWILDGFLIALGVGLMFVPGVNIFVAIGVGILAGAALGAGVSGLMYDFDHRKGSYSDKDYFVNMGIGAAAGAVTGGISGALDFIVPAVTLAEVLGSRGALLTSKVGRELVVRFGFRLTTNTLMGMEKNMVKTVASNIYSGKPLDEGLGQAAWEGAAESFGLALGGELLASVKPILKARFFARLRKLRYRGSYDLATQQNVSGLRRLVKTVEYPLRETGFDVNDRFNWNMEMSGSRLRYAHVQDVTSL